VDVKRGGEEENIDLIERGEVRIKREKDKERDREREREK
jgi:hypothetical protein